MGAKKEIERKFLIDEVPSSLSKLKRYEIVQGYLDHKRLRRTTKDSKNEYYLTIKYGRGLVRIEDEKKIDKEQFEQLWPKTKGRRLKKTRHLMHWNGHVLEIDAFHGKLEGFFLGEIEFKSKREAKQFLPPKWFGLEVTYDTNYNNRGLATNGLKLLRKAAAA